MTHTILVVDDDRDIRETMADALGDEGYEVRRAVDGLDALEQLRATPTLPHLILLDLMMPRMNGAEFRAAILQDDRLKTIPVVLITADAQTRAKAGALAVDGVLLKPVKLADLFRAISAALPASPVS